MPKPIPAAPRRRRATANLAKLALCGALALSLQGCVEMMVGGAVVGAVSATDRRTLGAQTEDRAIVLKGEDRIERALGKTSHVNVNSYNRKVLLTGEVKDEQAKAAAEREITMIEGVASVVNELEVAGMSGLTSRSNDALVTAKVKGRLVEAQDIFANSFKVVTERGTVFLMGKVTDREGRSAAEVARNVDGVRKVVKVLEYISEEELRRNYAPPQEQQQKQ